MYKAQNAVLRRIRLIGHCSLILFSAFCCAMLVSMLVIRPVLAMSQRVKQSEQHVVCCSSEGGEEEGGSSTSSSSSSSNEGEEEENGGSSGSGRSYTSPYISSSQGGSGTSDPGAFVAVLVVGGTILLIWALTRKSRRNED